MTNSPSICGDSLCLRLAAFRDTITPAAAATGAVDDPKSGHPPDHIVVVSSPSSQSPPNTIKMGRFGPQLTHVIRSTTISKHHVSIYPPAKNLFSGIDPPSHPFKEDDYLATVEDHAALNGTSLNGTRIAANTKTPLRHGDIIALGTAAFLEVGKSEPNSERGRQRSKEVRAKFALDYLVFYSEDYCRKLAEMKSLDLSFKRSPRSSVVEGKTERETSSSSPELLQLQPAIHIPPLQLSSPTVSPTRITRNVSSSFSAEPAPPVTARSDSSLSSAPPAPAPQPMQTSPTPPNPPTTLPSLSSSLPTLCPFCRSSVFLHPPESCPSLEKDPSACLASLATMQDLGLVLADTANSLREIAESHVQRVNAEKEAELRKQAEALAKEMMSASSTKLQAVGNGGDYAMQASLIRKGKRPLLLPQSSGAATDDLFGWIEFKRLRSSDSLAELVTGQKTGSVDVGDAVVDAVVDVDDNDNDGMGKIRTSSPRKPSTDNKPVVDLTAVKEAESRGASNFVKDTLMEQLTCTVCLEIMHSPHMTSCGHSFCGPCIFDWVASQQRKPNNHGKAPRVTCPNCRSQMSKSLVPAVTLQNLLEEMVPKMGLTAEEMKERKAKEQEFKNRGKPGAQGSGSGSGSGGAVQQQVRGPMERFVRRLSGVAPVDLTTTPNANNNTNNTAAAAVPAINATAGNNNNGPFTIRGGNNSNDRGPALGGSIALPGDIVLIDPAILPPVRMHRQNSNPQQQQQQQPNAIIRDIIDLDGDNDDGDDDDDTPQSTYAVEYAASGRSTCRTCNRLIAQGEIRFRETYHSEYDYYTSQRFHHSRCLAPFLHAALREQPEALVAGWGRLRPEERRRVKNYMDGVL